MLLTLLTRVRHAAALLLFLRRGVGAALAALREVPTEEKGHEASRELCGVLRTARELEARGRVALQARRKIRILPAFSDRARLGAARGRSSTEMSFFFTEMSAGARSGLRMGNPQKQPATPHARSPSSSTPPPLASRFTC